MSNKTENTDTMNRNRLVVLAGLPCSGKSKLSHEFKQKGYVRVYDYPSEGELGKNFECFESSFNKIKKLLAKGKNVLYCAPNITSKKRMAILKYIDGINCLKTCIVLGVPYEECIKNNQKKKNPYDETLVKTMYMRWDTPYFFEGWDKVSISLGEYAGYYGTPNSFIDKYMDYDQNKFHTKKTLGEHCQLVSENIETKSLTMKFAGILHDCGKPFVREPSETGYCKYYFHEKVGAYNTLFYEIKNPLKCSIVVGLHMIPYTWERDERGEIIRNYYRKLWGKQLFSSVMKLHNADKISK